jgi:hypothetical protein
MMGADEHDQQQAGLERELEESLAAGDVVVVCWEPGCTMHRLLHWAEYQWVSHAQIPDYRRYSHGICHWHYQAYRAEVERAIGADLAADAQEAVTAT